MPDIESQVAAYSHFIEYFDSGCPNDNFDGFELIRRLHMPGEGEGVVIVKSRSSNELFKHLAPWRAEFGIEFRITPAFDDKDIVENHRQLFAEMTQD